MGIMETDEGICIDDFKAAGVRENKYGLALIVNDGICRTAGVFTGNKIKAAPVIIDEERIGYGLQAVVVNSGNANACVRNGLQDAEEMCKVTAGKLGIDERNVGVASTGIIGRRLDMDLIKKQIKKAYGLLSNTPEGSRLAAGAIMTTDTRIKEHSIEYMGIKIGAIAKGAGMIAPDMATMLCFITTNADLTTRDLQDSLKEAVDESFNMLVIDGDMSTNDTVLLMSNKKKQCSLDDFRHALSYVTKEMAKQMASDGEGATKYLEVEVRGAGSAGDARICAKAVISSPLVKTAVHGENPNWGRIAAAIGSKIDYVFEKTDIAFESGGREVVVVEGGKALNAKDAGEVLEGDKIKIIVDLHSGDGKAVAYGCDLSPGYVKINAGYN